MNPRLLKVITQPNESFSIRKYVIKHHFNGWHFHPEVELTYIQKGSGIQLIADSIQRFEQGDLVLIGPNIPHFWRWDELFDLETKKRQTNSTGLVMHFRRDFWGAVFLDIPELKKINTLLQKSSRGLSIRGKTKEYVVGKMQEMMKAKETERVILLLDILQHIGNSSERKPIASQGYQHNNDVKQTDRVSKIYEYTLQHFKETIKLKDVARVSNISPHSFCRFFKSNTRKTYSKFVQEIRVGHACKLLIENRYSITYIGYESGFNNPTNFYKCFKNITGKTPLEYQKNYAKVTVDV